MCSKNTVLLSGVFASPPSTLIFIRTPSRLLKMDVLFKSWLGYFDDEAQHCGPKYLIQ